MPAAGAGCLEWRVHLARRQPARAVAAAGIALAAGIWAFALFHSFSLAIAAAGLLVAAVGEFLFPISYRLTPEAAEARNLVCWRRLAWADVRRIDLGDEGIKLSPLRCGGRGEAFRGVLLRCDANRELVLAAVQRFRDAATPGS
jgi:hypothetical protein